jgi:hypothetical protein
MRQRALTRACAYDVQPPSRVLTLANEHFCTVLPSILRDRSLITGGGDGGK